jgi:hypothetical protein
MILKLVQQVVPKFFKLMDMDYLFTLLDTIRFQFVACDCKSPSKCCTIGVKFSSYAVSSTGI